MFVKSAELTHEVWLNEHITPTITQITRLDPSKAYESDTSSSFRFKVSIVSVYSVFFVFYLSSISDNMHYATSISKSFLQIISYKIAQNIYDSPIV